MLKHQVKLAARKPQREYVTSGKPDLPLPQEASPASERRLSMYRKMLRAFGSIFAGEWLEREKRREILSGKRTKK